MYSRDPVATLTVLSAEQVWCPTVPDAVRQHLQHLAMTKDASRLQGLVGISSQMCLLVAGPLWHQGQKRAGQDSSSGVRIQTSQ